MMIWLNLLCLAYGIGAGTTFAAMALNESRDHWPLPALAGLALIWPITLLFAWALDDDPLGEVFDD